MFLRLGHVHAHVTPLHYLKLKKEEVIYKGSVYTNTRVLPLHTASSRASARDHVTWNAGTVTIRI
jgi:hypothetical protein